MAETTAPRLVEILIRLGSDWWSIYGDRYWEFYDRYQNYRDDAPPELDSEHDAFCTESNSHPYDQFFRLVCLATGFERERLKDAARREFDGDRALVLGLNELDADGTTAKLFAKLYEGWPEDAARLFGPNTAEPAAIATTGDDQFGRSTPEFGDKAPYKPARMSWLEAAERMVRLKEQGEAFTSRNDLSERFGCAKSTIQKAIKYTESLHDWAKSNAPTPSAQSIDAVVTDRTAQSRELSQVEYVMIREYQEREDLTPDERAFFNGLSSTAQLEFLDDPDADLSAADPVTKRKGRLHPRILGRKP